MSALQLKVDGIQEPKTGTTRLRVLDPQRKLQSVVFHLTDAAGIRSGPVAPDRSMPRIGLYEKNVLLDAAALVRVQPVVTLTDGTLLEAEEVAFGTLGEVPVPPAATIVLLSMLALSGRVEVTATLEGAVEWKCWLRRGAWPTENAASNGALLDEYLCFEGNSVLDRFETAASPGEAWYAVAIAYNHAGRPGPRYTASVQVAP